MEWNGTATDNLAAVEKEKGKEEDETKRKQEQLKEIKYAEDRTRDKFEDDYDYVLFFCKVCDLYFLAY